MEARLVEILQGRARGYQLQDLKCTKCGKVRDSRSWPDSLNPPHNKWWMLQLCWRAEIEVYLQV